MNLAARAEAVGRAPNRTAAPARPGFGTRARSVLLRLLVLGLLAGLIGPLLAAVFASSAAADDSDDNKESNNYSLYQLASNASSYFSEANSPEGKSDPDDRMTEDWREVTRSPATGGDMLGYADPKFSLGNIVGWLFASISGSSQTVEYGTLKTSDSGQTTDVYAGMLDYARFGATNADLGLDTMSSGIGGQIAAMIGGSLIWVLYALAQAVSMLFELIIQLLKLINPFSWFYQAVSSVDQTFGDGMVCSTGSAGAETCHKGGGALAGMQDWISGWYGTLNSIAWQALVPLFIALTVVGLIMFRKMDRGSAVKKLVVRIVYIGLGLPLVGSLYTGVLDKFDTSLLGQHAGPTRVVLSTYVDFQSWAMKDRLGIPDAAHIAWDNGQASSDAMMAVRTSALAINKQAHGNTYSDINVGNKPDDPPAAWRDGTTGMDRTSADDANAVFTTFGIIGDYITGNEVAASDFESGVKSSITKLDVDKDDKKAWFIGDNGGYGDVDEFGEDADATPTEHPVLAVGDKGLTSSSPGKDKTTFTTPGAKNDCGSTVWTNGAPAPCNLSALSMYNYLNTGFGPTSLTMYSSNNVTSGFTRENHMAVSQVGTGPAKFMYWTNAATVLGSISLLGFWYALGMLAGAVRRIFGLVAAIPFAALGALSAISKVIIYTVALILEVLVTLFIYQFVSQLEVSLPDVLTGPVSHLMSPDGLFGSALLGGIVVVILTAISSLLIIAVTIGLLRVRKVVLQAIDEMITKLIDKFLDTNTAPRPDKGGLIPALAAGAGAGAGMALGNKLASGLGRKSGGKARPPGTGKPGGKTGSTNAGGTNGSPKELTTGQLGLEAGDGSGGGLIGPGPDNPGPDGGRPDGALGPGGAGDARALPAANGPDGDPLQLTSGTAPGSRSDKEAAQNLTSRGGLTDLGYDTGSRTGRDTAENGQTSPGTENLPGSGAPGTSRRGRAPTPDRESQTQFGTKDLPATPGPSTDVPPGSGNSARFVVGSSGATQVDPGSGGTSPPAAAPGARNGSRAPAADRTGTAGGRSAATTRPGSARPPGLEGKRPLGLQADVPLARPAPRPVQARPRTTPPAPDTPTVRPDAAKQQRHAPAPGHSTGPTDAPAAEPTSGTAPSVRPRRDPAEPRQRAEPDPPSTRSPRPRPHTDESEG